MVGTVALRGSYREMIQMVSPNVIEAATAEAKLATGLVYLPGLEIGITRKQGKNGFLYYKPDGLFQPQVFRDIFKPLNVGILKLEITARGRIEVQGAKRTFVSGKDQFVVMDDALGAKIPIGTPILLEGIVDDRVTPMHVTVTAFKPL